MFRGSYAQHTPGKKRLSQKIIIFLSRKLPPSGKIVTPNIIPLDELTAKLSGSTKTIPLYIIKRIRLGERKIIM